MLGEQTRSDVEFWRTFNKIKAKGTIDAVYVNISISFTKAFDMGTAFPCRDALPKITMLPYALVQFV